jgi:hypothetical protein
MSVSGFDGGSVWDGLMDRIGLGGAGEAEAVQPSATDAGATAGAAAAGAARAAADAEGPSTSGPLPTMAGSVLEATLREADRSPQEQITAALGSGDPAKLAGLLADEVNIRVGGTDDQASPEGALAALRAFFDAHPAEGFEVLHELSSRSGEGKAFIGNLNAGGETFRTTVMYREGGSGPQIELIDIDG